jgi:translation initiation factor IF-1
MRQTSALSSFQEGNGLPAGTHQSKLLVLHRTETHIQRKQDDDRVEQGRTCPGDAVAVQTLPEQLKRGLTVIKGRFRMPTYCAAQGRTVGMMTRQGQYGVQQVFRLFQGLRTVAERIQGQIRGRQWDDTELAVVWILSA